MWLAGLAILACLAVAGLAVLQPWRSRIPLPESLTATSVVILNGEGDMMAEREADAPRRGCWKR